MYTFREDAVDHAAELRRAGEKLVEEMNKDRPDRNVISVTSVVEQALTAGEKRSAEWQADLSEHFDE